MQDFSTAVVGSIGLIIAKKGFVAGVAPYMRPFTKDQDKPRSSEERSRKSA